MRSTSWHILKTAIHRKILVLGPAQSTLLSLSLSERCEVWCQARPWDSRLLLQGPFYQTAQLSMTPACKCVHESDGKEERPADSQVKCKRLIFWMTWGSTSPRVCVHVQSTPTCTHTYGHTPIHAQPYTQPCMHNTHIHARTHTPAHRNIHLHTHIHAHKHTCNCLGMYIHVHKHTW